MLENIDPTEDLGIENLGLEWVKLLSSQHEELATLFRNAYNLIMEATPNDDFNIKLTNILIREDIVAAEKVLLIRKELVVKITIILQLMGVTVDKDYIDLNSLSVLYKIFNSFYLLNGIDDVIGVSDIIENTHQTAKDRFIEILELLYLEDLDELNDIIEYVEPNVLRGILIGLQFLDEDSNDYIDPSLKTRITNNVNYIINTLGHRYIKDGGTIGLKSEHMLTFFECDLTNIIMESKPEYIKNLISVLIISSASDEEIVKIVTEQIESLSDDISVIYKMNNIFKEAVLNG